MIGGTRVLAEVMNTPLLRAQGLSGRTSLEKGKGMLFVFESSGLWGFWMPNMRFAIDIVWLSDEKRVVDIARDVTPESYPKMFTPITPARYVLELPKGDATRLGLSPGIVVAFDEAK